MRRAAEAAGRDPDQLVFAAYLTVAIDDNPRTAATVLREYMSDYYGASAPEVVRMQANHAGTLHTAADWAAAYLDAGATHLIIRIAHPGVTGYDPAAGELRRLLYAHRPE